MSVQFLWVELWLGSRDWVPTFPIRLSDLRLDVPGASLPVTQSTIVTEQTHGIVWVLVDFRVPATAVDPSGNLELVPRPSSLLWKGSTSGPWVRVSPASGTIRALTEFRIRDTTFEANSAGQGYLMGLPTDGSFVVDLSSAQLDDFRIYNAVLRWPDGPETWKHSRLIQATGAYLGLIIILATTFVFSRQLRVTGRWRSRVAWVPVYKPARTK
jgi:hypothetical protein